MLTDTVALMQIEEPEINKTVNTLQKETSLHELCVYI